MLSQKIGERLVLKQCLISIGLLCYSLFAHATCFDLPARGEDVIGELTTYVTQRGDNFANISEKFDIGYYNLVESNPGIDPVNTPPFRRLILPTKHILPNAPREDIVINLAEMRIYFYPLNERKVYVYPVGIGREETSTPLGYLQIIERKIDPVWYPPESVRTARAKEGKVIPKMVLPGPDNPLGNFSLRLSLPTYLIHGTNDNSGVGRRSSSGCIRMFNQDIEELYAKTNNNTQVLIINQPVKIGRVRNDILLEVHLPLNEYESDSDLPKMKEAMQMALQGIMSQYQDKVMWREMELIAMAHQGIPQSTTHSSMRGIRISTLPAAVPRIVKSYQPVAIPLPEIDKELALPSVPSKDEKKLTDLPLPKTDDLIHEKNESFFDGWPFHLVMTRPFDSMMY